MSELRRKVAHLTGLSERYGLAESDRQGRVLAEVIQVLREMALDLDEVLQNQREIEDYVEEIDNDLLSLEEAVVDEEDEDEVDTGEEDEDGEGEDEDEAWKTDVDETYIELECPRCDQPSYFAEHLFYEDDVELTCPHCGYVVFDARADRLVTEDEAEAGGEGSAPTDQR
jgi:ribosomal protein S27AE